MFLPAARIWKADSSRLLVLTQRRIPSKATFSSALPALKTSTFSTWVSSRKVPVLKSLRSPDPVFLIKALTAVLPVNSISTLRGESSREKAKAAVARAVRIRAWTFMVAGVWKRVTDDETSVDELMRVC